MFLTLPLSKRVFILTSPPHEQKNFWVELVVRAFLLAWAMVYLLAIKGMLKRDFRETPIKILRYHKSSIRVNGPDDSPREFIIANSRGWRGFWVGNWFFSKFMYFF
jgi:hypothetical protein